MSKKLIVSVMAVALMLIAGAAMAGDLHYKVYGKAHVSTESLNNGDESSIFVSSNSTRVGIKGKYATDVEWATVIFQYESNANFNGEGNNTFSTRNSFAGIKGNWGALVWGRHDTPAKTLGRSVDLFGDRIGDARNITRVNYSPEGDAGPMGFDERPSDMMLYKSPAIGDVVVVRLQYVPEEGKDSYETLFSGSAVYDKDAFMIGLAYETHDKGYYGYNPANEDDMTKASNMFRVAAGFTAEKFEITGLFQSVSNYAGDEDVSSTAYGLGAAFMAAPQWTLKAQYYGRDFSVDNVPEGEEEPTDLGTAMLAVGVDFNLSKSALIYLAYATSMNQDNAYDTPFRGGHGQDYRWDEDDINEETGLPNRLGSSPYGIALGLIAKW